MLINNLQSKECFELGRSGIGVAPPEMLIDAFYERSEELEMENAILKVRIAKVTNGLADLWFENDKLKTLVMKMGKYIELLEQSAEEVDREEKINATL
jgi:hypothetical protein